MGTTLKDLSERTGVSKSVISMYLNKDPRVRLGEAKKKLIDATVMEMNYRPSHMACSLRKGRTQLLGLVVGGISDPFFSNLVEACLKYVEDYGYQLLISLTSWDEKRERKCLETLLDRQVDGVIYAPRFPDDDAFRERIVGYGTPIVLMNRRVPGLPAVCQDPRKAFDAMAGMFRERGCGTLAMPDYPNSESTKFFTAACEKQGIRPRVMFFDSDREIVERMFREKPEFLYIPSCWIAKDLLKLIRERNDGYRPVFVTGYNFPVDLIEDDGLAGVLHGHVYQYIRSVVDLLIECVEGAEKGNVPETEPRLIDMTFYPGKEFFRIRNLLKDTMQKANE
jgi:DNA-binding LacI/PurR family transcriptional regulator